MRVDARKTPLRSVTPGSPMTAEDPPPTVPQKVTKVHEKIDVWNTNHLPSLGQGTRRDDGMAPSPALTLGSVGEFTDSPRMGRTMRGA